MLEALDILTGCFRMRNGCWPPGIPRESHLHETWPGSRAPSNCSWLLRERHRQSWGHRGPAVPLDLPSSISCRSEERAMGQRHGPKVELRQFALEHELLGSAQVVHLLTIHLWNTTCAPGTAPGLGMNSKQERLTCHGSSTPAIQKQTFHR